MSTPVNPLGIVLFADDRERLPNGTIGFGTQTVDTTATLEFRILNRSDVAVTITGISLQIAEDYQIVSESSFEFPITLAPDEEFEFEINVFSEVEIDELFDYLQIDSSVAGAPLNFRLLTAYVDADSGAFVCLASQLGWYGFLEQFIPIEEWTFEIVNYPDGQTPQGNWLGNLGPDTVEILSAEIIDGPQFSITGPLDTPTIDPIGNSDNYYLLTITASHDGGGGGTVSGTLRLTLGPGCVFDFPLIALLGGPPD